MYRRYTVISLILLVWTMGQSSHFIKNLAFVTNKCLAQDAFRECPRITENLSKYTAVRE